MGRKFRTTKDVGKRGLTFLIDCKVSMKNDKILIQLPQCPAHIRPRVIKTIWRFFFDANVPNDSHQQLMREIESQFQGRFCEGDFKPVT